MATVNQKPELMTVIINCQMLSEILNGKPIDFRDLEVMSEARLMELQKTLVKVYMRIRSEA